MDYSKIVRLFNSGQGLRKDGNSLLAFHRTLRLYQSVQCFAAHEFQNHIELVLLAKKAVKRYDIGMTQFRESDCLCAKSFKQLRLTGQLRAKGLYGNLSFQHHVDAFINSAHAALTDSLGDFIIPNDLANHDLP